MSQIQFSVEMLASSWLLQVQHVRATSHSVTHQLQRLLLLQMLQTAPILI